MLIPPNFSVCVPPFFHAFPVSNMAHLRAVSTRSPPVTVVFGGSGGLMSHLVAAKVAFSIFDICRSNLRKAA